MFQLPEGTLLVEIIHGKVTFQKATLLTPSKLTEILDGKVTFCVKKAILPPTYFR